MWHSLSRLLLSVWFVGMVLLAIRNPSVQGQGDSFALHFPLIHKQYGGWFTYLPLMQTNFTPNLNDYVGLARVLRCPNGTPCSPHEAYPGFYTVGADGQPGTTLIDHFRRIGVRSWSPDGKSFIYGQTSGYGAWLVSVADGTTRPIAGIANSYGHGWSPDSRYVVLSSVNPLQIYDLQQEHLITLPVAEGFGAGGLAWSPDSRHLLLWSSGAPHSLWRWTAGAPEVTPISIAAEQVLTAQWAPDSRMFLYQQGESMPRLYTVAHDQTLPSSLIEGFAVDGWLADGSRILLRQNGDLYTTPRGTAMPTLFFDAETAVERVNLSPTGRHVVIATGTTLYLQSAFSTTAEPLPDCTQNLWYLMWKRDGTRFACSAVGSNALNVIEATTPSPTIVHQLQDHQQPQFLPDSPSALASYSITYDTSPGYPVPVFHGTHLFDTREGQYGVLMPDFVLEWRFMP